MKKLTTAVLLAASIMQPLAQSSEVDPHTGRQQNLRDLSDPTDKINYWVNYYIKKQINKINTSGFNANSEKRDCRIEPKEKMKELMIQTRKCLGGHWRTQCGEITLYRRLKYAKYGALGEATDADGNVIVKQDSKGYDYSISKTDGKRLRTYIHPSTSIYQDFGLIEAPSLTLVSMFHNSMGAHFKQEGMMIGSDKYSHFFNRGRKYFKFYQKDASKEARTIHKGIVKNYGKKYSAEEVEEISRRQREKYMLAVGKHSEESLFGAKSTGIASYGDLAANFAGGIFWNEFAGWGEDIRTLEPVPADKVYVKCNQRTGKFELKREFDIRDYMNSTWDEGNNCSVYQTELQAQNVKKRVNALKNENAKHCPLDLEKVREEGKRFFGRFYDQVVKEKPYLYIDKVITAEFGKDRYDNYGRFVGGMSGPKEKNYTKVPKAEKIITTRPIIEQEYHGNGND